MSLKEGDVVKVISVSGHSDIKNAVGKLGMIMHISDNATIDHISPRIYAYHVEYFVPIKCACDKEKCMLPNGLLWREFFHSRELEKVEIPQQQLDSLLEKKTMLRSLIY